MSLASRLGWLAQICLALVWLVSSPPSSAARPVSTVRYAIQYGDSLSGVAARFGVPAAAIQYAPLKSAAYPRLGTAAVVPLMTPPGSSPAMPAAWYCVHRVEPGETLYSIARWYGVDPYWLASVNWLYDPNQLYAGQFLRVPCRAAPPPPPPSGCGSAVYYVVQPGDNLFRIAIRYGTTVYQIAIANHLPNPNFVRSGTRLYIPCPHTVTYPPVPTPGAVIPYIGSGGGAATTPTPGAVIPFVGGAQPTATVTATVRVTVTTTVTPTVVAPSPTVAVTPTTALTPTRTAPSATSTLTPTVAPSSTRPAPSATRTVTPTAAATTTRVAPSMTPTRPANTPAPSGSPTPNPALYATAAPAPTQMISMENLTFNPFIVTVVPGTQVTWKNNEKTGIAHTVTSGLCSNGACTPSGQFDSGVLQPGQSYTVQFSTPGNYAYFCSIHGMSMTGIIVVR